MRVSGTIARRIRWKRATAGRWAMLRIVAAGRRARAHVFNLGHGISRHTDPAIARLLVDTVHAA